VKRATLTRLSLDAVLYALFKEMEAEPNHRTRRYGILQAIFRRLGEAQLSREAK